MPWRNFFRKEMGLILPILFYVFINKLIPNHMAYCKDNRLVLCVLMFAVLCFMLQCAFNIINHAHYLAEELGEPQGALILTLSVVVIEVAMMLSVLQHSSAEPTVVRDISFAQILIGINGFAGFSLLLGGLKYNSQRYNLEGASSYLAILICLSVLCLVLPAHIIKTAGVFTTIQTLVISFVCYSAYIMFIIQQTITHTDYFRYSSSPPAVQQLIISRNFPLTLYHGINLFVGLIIMVNLSENLSGILDIFLATYMLPKKLAGFIIASLVLVPEGMSAIRASANNQLQRSINLCLGSVLASLGVTLPTVLLYSVFYLKRNILLGIGILEQVVLLLTCLISAITFASKKTSSLYGVVLISILLVYLTVL